MYFWTCSDSNYGQYRSGPILIENLNHDFNLLIILAHLNSLETPKVNYQEKEQKTFEGCLRVWVEDGPNQTDYVEMIGMDTDNETRNLRKCVCG